MGAGVGRRTAEMTLDPHQLVVFLDSLAARRS
jgi:hypothetical protein